MEALISKKATVMSTYLWQTMIGTSWLVPGSWRPSLGLSRVPSAAFFWFLRDLRQGLEVGRFAGLGTMSVSRSVINARQEIQWNYDLLLC